MWNRCFDRRLGAICLLLTSGCNKLEEHDLGDEARQVFRDFDVDPAALPATVMRMDALLAELPLDGVQRKRSFLLPQLGPDFWEDDLTLPVGIESQEQLAMGIGGLSRHGIDANMTAQVQQDQVCINADAVKCHDRAPVTDVDCFLDGSCDVYRTRNAIRIQTMVAKFWLDVPVDFRWVELEDGRRAVVARTWLEESTESDMGKSEWRQRFGVDLFVEDPDDAGQTRRLYATWLGGGVGGVGTRRTASVIYSGMDDGFINPDAWLDGDECGIDTSECAWP